MGRPSRRVREGASTGKIWVGWVGCRLVLGHVKGGKHRQGDKHRQEVGLGRGGGINHMHVCMCVCVRVRLCVCVWGGGGPSPLWRSGVSVCGLARRLVRVALHYFVTWHGMVCMHAVLQEWPRLFLRGVHACRLVGVAQDAHLKRLRRLQQESEEALRNSQDVYLAKLRKHAAEESALREAVRRVCVWRGGLQQGGCVQGVG